MKKILSIGLMLVFMLTIIVPSAYAQESSTDTEYSVNLLDSSDVEVSDVMTYDEIIAVMAADQGIPLTEAAAAMGNASAARSSRASYRTLSISIEVNNNSSVYVPKLNLYCETSEYGQYWGIVQVLNTTLVTTYGSLSKVFSGEVYVNLETAYRVYYSVNGLFYNTGTVSVSYGNAIGVGQGCTTTYTITYSNSLYDSTSDYGTKSFQH